MKKSFLALTTKLSFKGDKKRSGFVGRESRGFVGRESRVFVGRESRENWHRTHVSAYMQHAFFDDVIIHV